MLTKNSPCNITLIEPNGDKAKEEKFKEIQEAYEILGDKENEPLTINTVTQPLNKVAWEAVASVADSAALISVIFFGDMFGDIFGGGGRGRQRVVRGEDLRYGHPNYVRRSRKRYNQRHPNQYACSL